MSKLRFEKTFEGPIPTEVIVQIQSSDGMQEVIVPKKQADRGYLEVFEVARVEDRSLVELPRETTAGHWRVWVPRSFIGDAA